MNNNTQLSLQPTAVDCLKKMLSHNTTLGLLFVGFVLFEHDARDEEGGMVVAGRRKRDGGRAARKRARKRVGGK